MKKRIIDLESLFLSDVHVKFGLEYRDAVFKSDNFYASFPYFVTLEALNECVLNLINAYYHDNSVIKMRVVYADERYVSMIINSTIAINYSVSDKALLPTELILKEKGIRKRNISRASKKVSKQGKVMYDTLRLTHDGIRVDVADRLNGENYTVRVRTSKK